MEFDFSKPAPQAKTLKEAQQIIDALWNRAVKFRTDKLKFDLNHHWFRGKVKDQFQQFVKSTFLWFVQEKKRKNKYYGPGKNKKLKQGAQPGHQGNGRKLLPVEEVDD